MKVETVLEVGTVNRVFRDCLLPAGAQKSTGKGAPYIIKKTDTNVFMYFDKQKIEANKKKILNMIEQLPREFLSRSGANFSGSNIDHRGLEWCNDESVQEQLVQLGYAIGVVRFIDPVYSWIERTDRETWRPGFVITMKK
jgi:hypothetical protein